MLAHVILCFHTALLENWWFIHRTNWVSKNEEISRHWGNATKGSGSSAVSDLFVLCNDMFIYLWTAPMKGAGTISKWALFSSLKTNPYWCEWGMYFKDCFSKRDLRQFNTYNSPGLFWKSQAKSLNMMNSKRFSLKLCKMHLQLPIYLFILNSPPRPLPPPELTLSVSFWTCLPTWIQFLQFPMESLPYIE